MVASLSQALRLFPFLSLMHGFEVHRPSIKGTNLLFQVIKAITNHVFFDSSSRASLFYCMRALPTCQCCWLRKWVTRTYGPSFGHTEQSSYHTNQWFMAHVWLIYATHCQNKRAFHTCMRSQVLSHSAGMSLILQSHSSTHMNKS